MIKLSFSAILNKDKKCGVIEMIVQLTGNVTYAITLDPTVWIFDDRKILLDDAFSENRTRFKEEENQLRKSAERWDNEVSQQKVRPPVNKSITRFEREQALKNTYVMPIAEFVTHSEIKPDATDVTLVTKNGEHKITLSNLQNSYLLFAVKGKPVTEEGPVHLFFKDGSNRKNPIKGIQKIIIN